MEDLHVVRGHVTMMTAKTTMCRRQKLRQDQLVRDPDLEMMINDVRDPDLETILRGQTDQGLEMMIMAIDAQYILVDYDPSTHLATKGQLMLRKVHLQR